MKYYCAQCGREYSVTDLVWRCTCGGYLNSRGNFLLRRGDVVKDQVSLWRYEKALPLTLQESTTRFQEGFTPLVETPWQGRKILFKVDYLMPTGSFKDRGNAILVNFLRKLGVQRVVEDSSGNAAASIAAYCAAAGIECDLFVPATTSAGKLVQITMYGAKLHRISGSREDVAAKAMEAGEQTFYASHNWHPLFIEGTKTLAFEIWEQLGWRAPENVIVPVGMGSALLGLAKGFQELLTAGEIESMPHLYAIQAQNCAPLYRAFTGEKGQMNPLPTVAEGVACARVIRTEEIINTVVESGGVIEAVTEEEIVQALIKAATLGYYVEPTSAVALAGMDRLCQRGLLAAEADTVVLLTGSGLKATDKISDLIKNKNIK
ncbi:MAG: threonine synthase [bacterium]|jgi:threonine synthase